MMMYGHTCCGFRVPRGVYPDRCRASRPYQAEIVIRNYSTGVNMEPKISVNKLGEYMDATASRRKQILRDQKAPQAFKAARYKDARETIVQHLEQGMADDSAAMQRAEELRNDHSGSDFAAQDRQLSAKAIEDFLPLAEEIEIEGLSVQSGAQFANYSMDFGGTKVSMRPDAILTDSATGNVIGCVKLNFSMSAPLQNKAAEYVATALRAHLENNLSSPEHVDPSLCYVVDVPTGSVTCAPKANKKRLSDLVAAGEEIAARWNTV